MKLISDFYNYLSHPVDQWKSLQDYSLPEHVASVGILSATTVLVVAVSGKRFAIAFTCVTALIYPFYLHQIVHIMALDPHEDILAVSLTALYLFAVKFPMIAPWGLPPFLTIVYANRSQWALIRTTLKAAEDAKIASQNSNKRLIGINEQLLTDVNKTKTAYQNFRKAKDTEKAGIDDAQTAIQEHQDIVEKINAESEQASKELNQMVQLFETAEKTEVGKLLQEISTKTRKLASITEQAESASKTLVTIQEAFKKANQEYEEMVQKGITDEKEFQKKITLIFSQMQSRSKL